jgi:hypothetical protein
MKIKPGMRFVHKQSMGKIPPLYQVCRIDHGLVYYRRVDVKNGEECMNIFQQHFHIEDVDKIVGVWVK